MTLLVCLRENNLWAWLLFYFELILSFFYLSSLTDLLSTQVCLIKFLSSLFLSGLYSNLFLWSILFLLLNLLNFSLFYMSFPFYIFILLNSLLFCKLIVLLSNIKLFFNFFVIFLFILILGIFSSELINSELAFFNVNFLFSLKSLSLFKVF